MVLLQKQHVAVVASQGRQAVPELVLHPPPVMLCGWGKKGGGERVGERGRRKDEGGKREWHNRVTLVCQQTE